MWPADPVRPGALALLAAALPVGAGCRGGNAPDAYGNFETTEIVVSAETPGQLVWFTPDDGVRLETGALVGVIDTIQLALERVQADAERQASIARAQVVEHQVEQLQVQHEIAARGYARTQRLHKDQAATEQQLDDAERDYRVLGEQVRAAKAQREAVRYDIASTTARIAQIEDRIRRSQITNPRAGTVLTSYAEAGEFVQRGQALYTLATLDSMELRAYVTEPQLGTIRIGQSAEVTIDAATDERRVLSGTVIWISAEAEFTPTPVQTREERADLVYAVKILVANDAGLLKIGMPADVRFPRPAETAQ